MELASRIQAAIMDPLTLVDEVKHLCELATQHNFVAVSVPPIFVANAKSFLSGSDVRLAATIGYPFGYSAIEAKVAEVLLAIVGGADELEIMINLTALKNNDWQYLAKEIGTILQVTHKQQKVLKVCIEAPLLTKEEMMRCCDVYGAAGVSAVITSSGYFEENNEVDVVGIRSCLSDAIELHVFCDGTYRQFKQLSDEGANRILTKNAALLLHEYTSLN